MSVFATRLLRRLLTLSVGAALSDSILGDLEEERQRREARSSRLAALWFWSNGIRVVAYVLTQRSQTAISTLVKASFVDTLLLDIRHAVRRLARRPAGAAALVLVLALGVGLTSAMFALADPFLLRPLPYARPHPPGRGDPLVRCHTADHKKHRASDL